ncbi:GntR family transcriptional regulator [Paenibacillus amylolyticus]|uniref:GntR family transcriptional regulator n=1 Tax=Paenibacillus amylolyticus TaxID=1451 RepID=UPI003EBD58F7
MEHSRLPSVRKCAELLGISTTPVEAAYQQLIAEGYIYSQPRRGYRVRAVVEGYHDIMLGKWDTHTPPQRIGRIKQVLRQFQQASELTSGDACFL